MRYLAKYFFCFLVVMLTGCATPQINTNQFAPPKSVVIADFPDMQMAATIEVLPIRWPDYYFNQKTDHFFIIAGKEETYTAVADSSGQMNQLINQQIANAPRPMSVGQAAAAGAVAGLVGGIIQMSAAATQKKAAEFPGLVSKILPNVDMRLDLLKALREGLEAKQIQVKIASETRNLPPRMFWPAKNEKGEPFAVGPLANSPPMDADLLVQLAPIAVYAAPGPLNSYVRSAGICIALFNARTREFLGWQAVYFNGPNERFSYSTYTGLVADLNLAAPALHQAFLSLVPEVVRIISAEKKP